MNYNCSVVILNKSAHYKHYSDNYSICIENSSELIWKTAGVRLSYQEIMLVELKNAFISMSDFE